MKLPVRDNSTKPISPDMIVLYTKIMLEINDGKLYTGFEISFPLWRIPISCKRNEKNSKSQSKAKI